MAACVAAISRDRGRRGAHRTTLAGVRLDPNRLVSAAAAPATLPALLSAAVAGRTTHLVDDGRVLAHLVPANALVITGAVEELLLAPAVHAEATRFADEIARHGYHHPGTVIGAILAWLWESSADAALRWLTAYTAELTAALTAGALSHPSFEPLWAALRPALGGYLVPDEVQDFEAAARARLAGGGAVRCGPRDPWPEVTPGGRCFAKKRYADVAVGDFIPGHPGADLDYDDGWCRVERLDLQEPGVIRASLRDADGQHAVHTAPDATIWVPSRSAQPWHWGLPR